MRNTSGQLSSPHLIHDVAKTGLRRKIRIIFHGQERAVKEYMQEALVEEATIDSLVHLMNAECKNSSSHGHRFGS